MRISSVACSLMIYFFFNVPVAFADGTCTRGIEETPSKNRTLSLTNGQAFKLPQTYQSNVGAQSDFHELSALTFVPDAAAEGGRYLLTVDDEQNRIFFLDGTDNQLKVATSISVPAAVDFEAVAYHEPTGLLAVASEHAGRIHLFQKSGQGDFQPSGVFLIEKLDHYATVVASNDGEQKYTLKDLYDDYIANTKNQNSGWEGMTFGNHDEDGITVYFLKEKDPALLVEAVLDLKSIASAAPTGRITNFRILNCGSKKRSKLCVKKILGAGQLNKPTLPERLYREDLDDKKSFDVSGLAFDEGSGRLWATSHQGRTILFIDPKTGNYEVYPLEVSGTCMEQPEGIALFGDHLYILNDRDQTSSDPEDHGPNLLFRFDVSR